MAEMGEQTKIRPGSEVSEVSEVSEWSFPICPLVSTTDQAGHQDGDMQGIAITLLAPVLNA